MGIKNKILAPLVEKPFIDLFFEVFEVKELFSKSSLQGLGRSPANNQTKKDARRHLFYPARERRRRRRLSAIMAMNSELVGLPLPP